MNTETDKFLSDDGFERDISSLASCLENEEYETYDMEKQKTK